MQTWQMQEAKSHLSEVVRDAEREGPQQITVHGRPVAVVLSRADYDRLAATGESLVAFVRSPFTAGGRRGAQRRSRSQPHARVGALSYLLDTSVLSELRRREPDAQVVRWLDLRPPSTLFLSVLTLGELRKGVEALPAGDVVVGPGRPTRRPGGDRQRRRRGAGGARPATPSGMEKPQGDLLESVKQSV